MEELKEALVSIKNDEKALVIHHNDFDGRLGAYFCLIKNKDNDNLVFHETQYSEPLPFDLVDKDTVVYFVDYSPSSQEDLDKMIESAKNVQIIDHHKTVLDKLEIPEKNIGLIDLKMSGALNSYYYFAIDKFLKEDKPKEWIMLINDYDIWNNEDEDRWNERVMPFQYGLRLYDTNPKSKIWTELDSDDKVEEIIEKGKTILTYEAQQNKERWETYGYDIEWEDYKFCVLSGVRGSMSFDDVYTEKKYDGMIAYAHGKSGFVVSIYTTKDIDMSKIAVKHGGGGHMKACGFTCKELPWEDKK